MKIKNNTTKKTPTLSTAEMVYDQLEQNKLTDVVKIDVANKFTFSDWFFVATASSQLQARRSAEKIKTALSEYQIDSVIEGINSDRWILIDAGDFIIHIFINEYREYYDLEGLWDF